jgi:hypothetical protein
MLRIPLKSSGFAGQINFPEKQSNPKPIPTLDLIGHL